VKVKAETKTEVLLSVVATGRGGDGDRRGRRSASVLPFSTSSTVHCTLSRLPFTFTSIFIGIPTIETPVAR
jgi:hypothetical protein